MQHILNDEREKWFWTIVLTGVVLFYALFIYRTSFMADSERYFTLRDDAMVSMRYAKHLASGHGLVWNIGEAPVEGFTNLGWTLYMAALHWLPVPASKISLLVMASSAVLLLGIGWLVHRLTTVIAPDSAYAPRVAFIIVTLYYPLVYWSLRGMEVGLITFLICALALLAIEGRVQERKRSLLAGLLIFLALLVRMDAIVQVSIILVYIFFSYVYRQRVSPISLTPVWVLFLIGAVGVPLFQWAYFGAALPNTYYLKLSGVTLAERFNTGLQTLMIFSSPNFLAPLFIVILGLKVFPDLRRIKAALFLALFAIQCVYSVYVGGDYAESLLGGWVVGGANRFVLQGMPFLIVLFSIVVERILTGLHFKPAGFKILANTTVVIALAALTVISGKSWFEWSIYNAPGLDLDISKTRLGLHIRAHTDPDALIAVHAAGQIPYFSERAVVDLLGKSDPVIAYAPPVEGIPFFPGHNKWNYSYSILELRPDLIADEWGFLNGFMTEQPGYTRLENGIWIWDESPRLDAAGLNQDF